MRVTQVLGCLAFQALLTGAGARPEASSGRQAPRAATAGSYDYVVVGSGPGGGPLAARLAIAGKKVLLLEAGGDPGNVTEYQVPALHLASTEHPQLRWDYYVQHYNDSTAQARDSKMTYRLPSGELYVGKNAPAGATPLGILYPRAGTLGGCAAHNALITVYPHASDWEYIRSVTGDSSWAASNMRKYFQRLENTKYLPNGIVGHGFSGWLTTSVTDLTFALTDAKLLSIIISAATAMGKSLIDVILSTITGLVEVLTLDINADFPGRDATEGLFQVPITVKDGVRASPRDFVMATANAVNADGSRKYYLDIQLNTLVTKVRFDTTGSVPRATGVDFITGSSLYRADPRASSQGSSGVTGSVNATSEVILAAGAFNTPQLLKLSGVGPAAELNSFNIPVVADLPGVGTNLQDRYETTVIGVTDKDFGITQGCTFGRTADDPCLAKWKSGNSNSNRGIYASNGIAIGVVKKSTVAEGDPDLFVAGGPVYFPGYYPGYSVNGTLDGKHWSWITLKAHSRNNAGTVKLASADPRDMPAITFNSFAGAGGDKDVQAVVDGMEFSRKMFSNLIPLDGSFKEVWPGTGVTGDKLKDFVRNEAWGHHASCTCPMGASNDPAAVVTSDFKVRGVNGLRVVDASVFPKIPGFYIAVPVYMISEKAADAILGL
ncbi:alcohol dehydrogenase [Thozetella sp. PMI_491]|nr:alcohol dehydrogenase [Thozetella sp. PMI_491]